MFPIQDPATFWEAEGDNSGGIKKHSHVRLQGHDWIVARMDVVSTLLLFGKNGKGPDRLFSRHTFWSPKGAKTSGAELRSPRTQTRRHSRRIIIIHLLGLAPAGYLAAPDNGP
jgi:hypothetical protein